MQKNQHPEDLRALVLAPQKSLAARKITANPKSELLVQCKKKECKKRCLCKPRCSPESTPRCSPPESTPDDSCPSRCPPKSDCNFEAITFNCNFKPKCLKCIDLDENLIIHRDPRTGVITSSQVIRPSVLNSALGEDNDILACVDTTCTEECVLNSPSSPICSITHTDSTVTFNNGIYKITRTFVVTDACGNSASIDQTVTFTGHSGDPPVITLPPIPVSQRCSASPPVNGNLHEPQHCDCIFIGCDATAADVEEAFGEPTVDRCVKVTHRDSPVRNLNCYKEKTRTWTAKDECGNTSSRCRTVRWSDDTTKPVITFPPNCDLDITLTECNPSETTIDSYFCEPTTDDCAILDHIDVTTANDCCTRTKTRTWRARDICGNVADEVSQSVTYPYDVTDPSIGVEYEDKAIPCDEELEFDEPQFFDACDGNLTVTFDDVRDPEEEGEFHQNGTYTVTRTWTATDNCGNSTTSSQTITVGPCGPPNGRPKGCLREFWAYHGSNRWDSLFDFVVSNMPAPLRFTHGTNFWAYFGVVPFGDLSPALTMLQAVSMEPTFPSRPPCVTLVTEAVSALLSAAAFPDDYRYPFGANSFFSLYDLIRNTLTGGNPGECANLAAFLSESSTFNNEGICELLPSEDIIPGPRLKVTPKERVAKPTTKQQSSTKVVPRKTFVPANAN